MGTCLDLEQKICVLPRASRPADELSCKPAPEPLVRQPVVDAELRLHQLICGHDSHPPVAGIVPFVRHEAGVHIYGVAFNPKQVNASIHRHQGKTFNESWVQLGQRGALINGGFFGMRGEAMGLLVAGGQQLAPPETEGPYSALLTVTHTGEWNLSYLRNAQTGRITIPADTSDYQLALQAGPMIIEPGGKIGVPPPSEEPILANRTIIVKTTDERWFFLVAQETDLYQLQNALLQIFPNIDAAMALDGGPSSGLAVATLGVMMAPVTPIPVSLHIVPTE